MWEFGLEKLIFRTGEEVRFFAGDGGEQVMDNDRVSVEHTLLVGEGGQLNGEYGAFLLGDDGPEIAVVTGNGKSQESFKGAGVEV